MIIERPLSRPVRTAFAIGLFALLAAAAARGQGILVLGDSISAAYGMSLDQGWVAEMARELGQTHPGIEVVNASISGETTAGGLRRLPDLLERHRPDLVILELGGNDGLRGYPIQSLRRNLAELVSRSREAGAAVILLPMEIPPNYGSRYAGAFRDSYPRVAEQAGAVLGPFLLDGVATVDGMMQADGIHPTESAQSRLAQNVLPTVVELLESL